MANIKIGKADLIWAYIGNFFKVAANIILLPVVLKMLSDDELGIWYVFGSVSQIVVLLDFGFAATVARNIAYAWCGVDSLQKDSVGPLRKGQETNFEYFKQVLDTCRIIYLIIAGVALLLLLSAGLFYIRSLDETAIAAWIIYSIGVAVNLLYCYYTSFMRGIGAIAENNKAAVISKTTQIVFTIALLMAGMGIMGVSIAYLASGLVLGIASKLYFENYENIKEKLKTVKNRSTIAEIKNMFGIIWYNASKDGLVTVANYLNTQANTLICSSVLGLATTGSYGLSVQLATITVTIAGIPFSSALPKLQEKAAQKDKDGSCRLFSGTMVMFVASYIALTGVVVLLLPVIKWLKPTLIIDVSMLLIVFFLLFIDKIYHLCASLISTFNTLPYTNAFFISSICSVILSYVLATYTYLDLWGIMLSPIIVAAAYNLWKWPIYVLRLYGTNVTSFMSDGWLYTVHIIEDNVHKLFSNKH